MTEQAPQQDVTTVEYEAPDDHAQFTETRFYRIQDSVTSREFEAVVVAAITTEDVDLPRWTTMEVYRTTSGRYVYYRVGHSLIYHALGTECRSGTRIDPQDLPDFADPCERCHPPLDPTEAVKMEVPLRTSYVCDDVTDVIRALVKVRNGTATLSRPAQRLLDDAARRDPAFQNYQVVERL